MEQPQESISSYYNEGRKRSFFFSRFFVIVSMIVLVTALGINISVLYSQDRTSTTTRADSGNNQTNLPPLPEGCEYQTIDEKVVVTCPTKEPEVQPTRAGNPEFPMNVRLPKLPAQCEYMNSTKGVRVSCSATQPPIPTVAVRALTSCQPSEKKDTLTCTSASNNPVAVPLPSLPEGCTYKLVARNYFIDCNTPEVIN